MSNADRLENHREKAIELIRHAEHELRGIHARWHLISAFYEELKLRTREKEFLIAGWLPYQAILDARDMMVVRFGEWTKVAYRQSGFFAQIRGVPGGVFHIKSEPGPQDAVEHIGAAGESPEDRAFIKRALTDELHKKRLALYAKVFPTAAGEKRPPGHTDIDELKDRFQQRLTQVVADRDSNRAHPYGRRASSSSAKMLSIEDLRDGLEYAFDTINHLRLLATRSSSRDPGPQSEARHTAADLVDLVLFGSKRRMDFLSGLSEASKQGAGKRAWEYRNEFYERLHGQPSNSDAPFNHPDNLPSR